MSIIGTFGGWNIVAMPTSPGLSKVEFTMHDSVATVKSIFTGQVQVQQWPGADFWSVSFSLPPLTRAKWSNWVAFLAELRGQANVFQLGDPLALTPQGTPYGIPLVNGTPSGITNPNAIGTTILYTRGWKASQFRLLLPGDYLQLGHRLHMVVDAVNSDSSGNAAISIWPSIRDTTSDGESIVLNNCTGLFRLATNDRKWSVSTSRTAAIDIPAVEAR
jgi:hypothetical protein